MTDRLLVQIAKSPITPRASNTRDLLLDIAVIEEGSELKGRTSLLFQTSLKPGPFGFTIFALLTSWHCTGGIFSCSHSLPQVPETGVVEIKSSLPPYLSWEWLRKKRQLIICRAGNTFKQLSITHLSHLSRGSLCSCSKTHPTSCANSSDVSGPAWETHPATSALHPTAFRRAKVAPDQQVP